MGMAKYMEDNYFIREDRVLMRDAYQTPTTLRKRNSQNDSRNPGALCMRPSNNSSYTYRTAWWEEET